MTGSSTGAPSAPPASQVAEVAEPLVAPRPAGRPLVMVGALFLVFGGTLLVVGTVLPWITSSATSLEGATTVTVEESVNGFSSQLSSTGDGMLFAVLGLVLVAFGVLQLWLGRLAAVAIAAIAVGSVAVITTLDKIAALKDERDTLEKAMVLFTEERSVSFGAGPWLMLVGAVAAVAGGVAIVAKRR